MASAGVGGVAFGLKCAVENSLWNRCELRKRLAAPSMPRGGGWLWVLLVVASMASQADLFTELAMVLTWDSATCANCRFTSTSKKFRMTKKK